MENATKALMIAAAVLVAILIISLGIGIFNSAAEQAGSADLTEYQIQTFNDKFKKYEKTNVKGSEVNAMLETVFNHNISEEDASLRVGITCKATNKPTGWKNVKAGAAKPTKSYPTFATGEAYSITITKYDAAGLVETITIDNVK